MKRDYQKLQDSLNIQFDNLNLLKTSLTHKSAHKNHNERLEFLGDSILSFVITAELYKAQPSLREGDLSRLRASLVRGSSLSALSAELGLGDYLYLGSGELKSGGFRRESILEDAFEALLGAYYLDQGFEKCEKLILQLFQAKLKNLPSLDSLKDPKTRLQEYLQAKKLEIPLYEMIKTEGKAHNQQFTIRCTLSSFNLSLTAKSSSRKKAEQKAATKALEKIIND